MSEIKKDMFKLERMKKFNPGNAQVEIFKEIDAKWVQEVPSCLFFQIKLKNFILSSHRHNCFLIFARFISILLERWAPF